MTDQYSAPARVQTAIEKARANLRAAEDAAGRAADMLARDNRRSNQDAWESASIKQSAAFWELWRIANPRSTVLPDIDTARAIDNDAWTEATDTAAHTSIPTTPEQRAARETAADELDRAMRAAQSLQPQPARYLAQAIARRAWTAAIRASQ